jgi:translation initiation factor IF-2
MDFSKYLPSPEMQADFETYKKLAPEERIQFQEERAKRIKSGTPEEQATFKADTKKSLIAIKERLNEINMRLDMEDVANALSLSYIAKTYFGKSKAWLYQRLNGYNVNGKPARFTDEERKTFIDALHDLSRRIEDTALKFS